MPRRSRSGFVTNRSSPISCTRSPSAAVSLRQPSQSSSAKPSSMLRIGYASPSAQQRDHLVGIERPRRRRCADDSGRHDRNACWPRPAPAPRPRPASGPRPRWRCRIISMACSLLLQARTESALVADQHALESVAHQHVDSAPDRRRPSSPALRIRASADGQQQKSCKSRLPPA